VKDLKIIFNKRKRRKKGGENEKKTNIEFKRSNKSSIHAP
jgi:hypothetical protein